MKNKGFKYIKNGEQLKKSHLKIPKALIFDERYKGLTSNAKMLYSILLDRTCLSAKNGWIDNEERIFVICEIDEIEIFLGCARGTANKTLKELEKHGLVLKCRQGQGYANLLYIASVDTSDEDLDSGIKSHIKDYSELKKSRSGRKENFLFNKFNYYTSKKNNNNRTTVEENKEDKKCLQPLETLGSIETSKTGVQNIDVNNTEINNTESIVYVCSNSMDNSNKISNELLRTLEEKSKSKTDPSAWLKVTVKNLIAKNVFTLEEYKKSVKEYVDKMYGNKKNYSKNYKSGTKIKKTSEIQADQSIIDFLKTKDYAKKVSNRNSKTKDDLKNVTDRILNRALQKNYGF